MPISVRRPDIYSRARPMSEMNVTPFIDVLLVLIIMLIMVVPIATHKTEVELPGGPPGMANPLSNTIHIDAQDSLFWNGELVSRAQLGANLRHASTLAEEPVLRFEPSAQASYDRSAKTIALIKDSGTSNFAFIGNERHRDFKR